MDQVHFTKEYEHGETATTTVCDYFSRKFGRMRCNFMPCINTKCKIWTLLLDFLNFDYLADKNPPEYYPIELCRIVGGQPVRGKLADQEVSGLIRAVATPAPQTFDRIRDLMNKVKPEFEGDLASVGLEVEPKMVKGIKFTAKKIFQILELNV